MSDFLERDNEAQTTFDKLSFDNGSIDDLHLKALGVYDAEIAWYKGAAKRRWVFSVMIRWAAIISGGAGVIILELAAYTPKAAAAQSAITNAPAIATMLLVISGLILLADRVLLINRNYVQYRVTQFKLETLRADFNASFIETYAKGIKADPATLYTQLHTLSAKSLKALADEVESETKAWQISFNEGMAVLSKRFDKDLLTGKAQLKKAQEAAEKETTAALPAALDVKVKLKGVNNQNRKGEFVIHIDGATPEKATAGPGETRSFSMPPGLRTVTLKIGDKVIESKSAKLKADDVNPTLQI